MTQARKGTGSVLKEISIAGKHMTARCLSPFSRTITYPVGPPRKSRKWDRHESSDTLVFLLKVNQADLEPVPFSRLHEDHISALHILASNNA